MRENKSAWLLLQSGDFFDKIAARYRRFGPRPQHSSTAAVGVTRL
jgi:hypothetical protein